MSKVKENIMKTVIDESDRDVNFTFSIDELAKKSGHTTEITRKWVNIFLKKGLIQRTDKRPFRGALSTDVIDMSILEFFIIYNKCN